MSRTWMRRRALPTHICNWRRTALSPATLRLRSAAVASMRTHVGSDRVRACVPRSNQLVARRPSGLGRAPCCESQPPHWLSAPARASAEMHSAARRPPPPSVRACASESELESVSMSESRPRVSTHVLSISTSVRTGVSPRYIAI